MKDRCNEIYIEEKIDRMKDTQNERQIHKIQDTSNERHIECKIDKMKDRQNERQIE